MRRMSPPGVQCQLRTSRTMSWSYSRVGSIRVAAQELSQVGAHVLPEEDVLKEHCTPRKNTGQRQKSQRSRSGTR